MLAFYRYALHALQFSKKGMPSYASSLRSTI